MDKLVLLALSTLDRNIEHTPSLHIKKYMNKLSNYKRKQTRNETNNLIKKGKLKISGRCELCKSNYRIIPHHFSYNISSIVVALCSSCHSKIHPPCMKPFKKELHYLIEKLTFSLGYYYQRCKLYEKYNDILVLRLEELFKQKK